MPSPPLRLELHRCWYFVGLLAAVHSLAAACLVPLDLGFWVKLCTGVLVLASFFHYSALHALRTHARAVTRVAFDSRGGGRLFTRQGKEITAALLGDSYVHPWVVIVRFCTDEGACISVVVLPVMLDPESFRELRVHLRLALDALHE